MAVQYECRRRDAGYKVISKDQVVILLTKGQMLALQDICRRDA